MYPRLYASYRGQEPIELWRATPTVSHLSDAQRRHIVRHMTTGPNAWEIWFDHAISKPVGAQKLAYRRTLLNAPVIKHDEVEMPEEVVAESSDHFTPEPLAASA